MDSKVETIWSAIASRQKWNIYLLFLSVCLFPAVNQRHEAIVCVSVSSRRRLSFCCLLLLFACRCLTLWQEMRTWFSSRAINISRTPGPYSFCPTSSFPLGRKSWSWLRLLQMGHFEWQPECFVWGELSCCFVSDRFIVHSAVTFNQWLDARRFTWLRTLFAWVLHEALDSTSPACCQHTFTRNLLFTVYVCLFACGENLALDWAGYFFFPLFLLPNLLLFCRRRGFRARRSVIRFRFACKFKTFFFQEATAHRVLCVSLLLFWRTRYVLKDIFFICFPSDRFTLDFSHSITRLIGLHYPFSLVYHLQSLVLISSLSSFCLTFAFSLVFRLLPVDWQVCVFAPFILPPPGSLFSTTATRITFWVSVRAVSSSIWKKGIERMRKKESFGRRSCEEIYMYCLLHVC